MSRILIFGDSTAYGRWDKRGGWAERLRSLYMEKNIINIDPYWEVYNFGVDGDCSKDLLERLEFEIKQRITEGEGEIIIVFAIGLNDSQIGRIGIGTELFKSNIEKLCNIASKYSSKIIFIGLNSVDELKTNPMPWDDENMFYTNEKIEKYNNIIKSICQENNIHFIDMFNEFNKLNYKKLLEDGLHPNSEGHQKMFEIVKDFLIEYKIVR